MTDLQKTDALVSAAQAGDDTAFQRLISQHRLQVYGVVQKMIGHPQDTDDIVQEALLKAWRSLPQFRGDSAFSTWLISIATRSALDFLRDQKRWRAEAQVAYANLCAESEELSGEVIAAFMEPEFAFDVRQHISYCFACVGRSLPPDEMAALVLRDFAELSAREAATALGISDSVLRHRLSAARASMRDKYENLCALVNKTGICHQCKGLKMIAAEGKQGGPFPPVDDIAERFAVVRSANGTSMRGLHDIFWRRTKEVEEQGLGSTEPDSACGEDIDT